MRKCCQRASTPYCPECGSAINDSPLRKLLLHVEANVKKFVEDYEWQSNEMKPKPDAGWLKKKLEKVDQWKGWAQALKEAIAKEST